MNIIIGGFPKNLNSHLSYICECREINLSVQQK